MAQFCEHCGTPLHMTDNFCPGCGRIVNNKEEEHPGGSGAAGAAGAAAAGAASEKTGYQSAGGQKDWDAFRSTKKEPNPAQAYYEPEVGREMGVGNWILTLIITAIPIVGFIMLIIWAVGGSPKFPARRNWAIAQFILMAIFIALGIIFTAIAGLTFGSIMSSGTLS